MRTLRGQSVDRPAVNFYEVGGFLVDPDDPDPLNVYHSPDWRPLIELAEEHTDLIRSDSSTGVSWFCSAIWKSPIWRIWLRTGWKVKVRRALDEGTAGEGRGFVLMPSAAPYGRVLYGTTHPNYETMIRLAEAKR